MIDQLASHVRNYRAVLWDHTDQALIVVPGASLPHAPGRLPKVVMRPNYRSKWGTALAVVSLGSAEPSDLADINRYWLLVGRVK